MTTPCIIRVAITGSVPQKADNPAVPITVSEQIESTHAAPEAGASIAHCHVRQDDGPPTSDPERFARLKQGIEAHCPGMIVQRSTGGRSGAGQARGTARISGMILLILLGAGMFNAFLAAPRTPMIAADAIVRSGLSPMLVPLAILALYVVLGAGMDSLSMLRLTVPIFYPIVSGLDFGLGPEETLIWFGIHAAVVVEVGLITPPVGMNVFVINGMARGVPMSERFRGVLPFLISDAIRIAALVAFPTLTLGLVRLLGWGPDPGIDRRRCLLFNRANGPWHLCTRFR